MKKVVTISILLTALTACAPTYQMGAAPIQSGSVEQIQKGVSTAADVQRLLGKPTTVTMMGDGRRMAFYSSYQVTSAGHANPAAFIPVVGLFATHTATATSNQQTLQIIFNKQGVVEDYEFNDTASNANVRASIFGGTTMTSTPSDRPQ